jgi:hypothetical protein
MAFEIDLDLSSEMNGIFTTVCYVREIHAVVRFKMWCIFLLLRLFDTLIVVSPVHIQLVYKATLSIITLRIQIMSGILF